MYPQVQGSGFDGAVEGPPGVLSGARRIESVLDVLNTLVDACPSPLGRPLGLTSDNARNRHEQQCDQGSQPSRELTSNAGGGICLLLFRLNVRS